MALSIDEGTGEDAVVWLHLAPAGAPGPDGPARPAGASPEEPRKPDDAGLELPDGFGHSRPVSVDGRVARALTRGGETLEGALRPLGAVLGSIHRSLAAGDHRPDEVTVEFGVTLGSDLSLGVFSGNGEASFKVSATWNLGSGSTT
ncbi:CU044_2847 family protein [Streptomyces sp. CB02923]|uniref:CU044_2847 family protein n=1 Tax=Streptomyces sp. CB02923 TaxID=1718985 RepID=UPI001F5BEFDC|nr:CU044_2847 family protein [Streptomyces sp. CB02923]